MMDETFSRNLYLEHLEEASLLYEYRMSLSDYSEESDQDKEDTEERFEAHIDALVIGSDIAIDVCRQQISEGEYEALYPSICLFCRQHRMDLIQEVQGLMNALNKQDLIDIIYAAMKREKYYPKI